jgi:hypothetical protein
MLDRCLGGPPDSCLGSNSHGAYTQGGELALNPVIVISEENTDERPWFCSLADDQARLSPLGAELIDLTAHTLCSPNEK